MRKFKPYLTIDRQTRLVRLLEKYSFPSDNNYEFSKIELQTEEDIKEEVNKIKIFYSFNSKANQKEFVDDTLFIILLLAYLREKTWQFHYVQSEFSKFYVSNAYIEKIGINSLHRCMQRYLSDPTSFIHLYNLEERRSIDYFRRYFNFTLEGQEILSDNGVSSLLLADFIDRIEYRTSLFLSLITSSLVDFRIVSLILNSSESTLPYNEIIDQDCTNLILIYLSQYK